MIVYTEGAEDDPEEDLILTSSLLYGMIHARYIITTNGLLAMVSHCAAAEPLIPFLLLMFECINVCLCSKRSINGKSLESVLGRIATDKPCYL